MSIVIKSEPISGVVELSSDDEETVSTLSTVDIEIPITRPTGRPSTPDTQCSICLDNLTNKCRTDTCWHLFCFECLQRWSNVSLVKSEYLLIFKVMSIILYQKYL